MRRLLALIPSVAALDVLCVGCSGGTGVRAVRGLIANGLAPSSLRFVTRDPQSPGRRTLAGLGLTPVIGDLDDAASLTKLAAGNYDACYVHGTSGDEKKIDEREVPRAAALAAAFAATSTPPLVVYNSASAPDNTGIPRIEQKHAVEEVLREALPRVAVLRAHLFMEELWKTYTRPSIVTKRTYAFSVRRDKLLCLTSVRDMGAVAARCASNVGFPILRWTSSPTSSPRPKSRRPSVPRRARPCATARPGSCTSSLARSCPSSTRSCGSTGRRTLAGTRRGEMSYSRRSRRRPSSSPSRPSSRRRGGVMERGPTRTSRPPSNYVELYSRRRSSESTPSSWKALHRVYAVMERSASRCRTASVDRFHASTHAPHTSKKSEQSPVEFS